MTKQNIMETVADLIEKKIIGEWKHEGYIDRIYSDGVDFELDGKHYSLILKCHEEGE